MLASPPAPSPLEKDLSLFSILFASFLHQPFETVCLWVNLDAILGKSEGNVRSTKVGSEEMQEREKQVPSVWSLGIYGWRPMDSRENRCLQITGCWELLFLYGFFLTELDWEGNVIRGFGVESVTLKEETESLDCWGPMAASAHLWVESGRHSCGRRRV